MRSRSCRRPVGSRRRGRIASVRPPSIPRPADFIEFARCDLESSMPARFRAIAARAPDAVAVRGDDVMLDYRTLAAAVTRGARTLAAMLGPAPEPVAILMDSGAGCIAATL